MIPEVARFERETGLAIGEQLPGPDVPRGPGGKGLCNCKRSICSVVGWWGQQHTVRTTTAANTSACLDR
jgi:hypothetical protein